MAHLERSVDVDAAPQVVWDSMVDWESQGEWIPATRVRGTAQDGRGVGGGVEAWSGVGPLGFLDTMVITEWDPPRRCVVRHTGRVVRGSGAFEVEELAGGRSRFVMSEDVQPPFGALGRAAWPVVRPLLELGLARSLRRFARLTAARG